MGKLNDEYSIAIWTAGDACQQGMAPKSVQGTRPNLPKLSGVAWPNDLEQSSARTARGAR